MRIGLYGGCFNPVHQGHLAAARGAVALIGLDKLLFIPSGHPPLKGNAGLVDGAHRLAMLELAIAGETRMAVSTIELDREGPSFTVDTVRTLREELPEGAEMVFLLGDDCLDRLPRWKGIEDLHAILRFAILPRSGRDRAGADPRMLWLQTAPVAVSSTQIRSSFAAGRCPPANLLPPAVADYILRHDLYGQLAVTACA